MLIRAFEFIQTITSHQKKRNLPYLVNLCNKKFTEEIIKLTHTGEHKMVNIGKKTETLRFARASCYIKVKQEIIEHIRSNSSTKGDVLRISEIAGILAAKKTSDLIPLCHQINLDTVNIKIRLEQDKEIVPDDEHVENIASAASLKDKLTLNKIFIESYVESVSKTGVEMEAMVSVSIAALTLYDMCKSVDKSIEISEIKLIEKFGGKSGHYHYKSL